MTLGHTRTADISPQHRELLHVASLDPDTTALLSRYAHVETAVGVAAGVVIGIAGGIMAAVEGSSGRWSLLPVAVGAALAAGVWVRSQRWVAKVRRSLISPAYAASGPARFGRQPLRHYPYLPGPYYAELANPGGDGRDERMPLIAGQPVPASRSQPAAVTVIASSKRFGSATAIIVEDLVVFAAPTPMTTCVRRLLFCPLERS